MAGNSPVRRFAKRILRPLLNDRVYSAVQAVSMARDIRSGAWRETEIDLLPYAVHAGDSVLDVGANYGLYSYHLSRAVGRNGRVYAFEPVPFTARSLRLIGRLLRFRNVEIIERGVSDKNGTISFTLPVQESGAIAAGQAHIAGRNDEHPGKEKWARYGGTREVTCEVVRLDDFLPTGTEIDFIKMDIEGAELLALKGATSLIERCLPTVLCEINNWFLDGFGFQLDDLLGFFRARGYVLYWWDDRAQKLVRPTLGEKVDDNYVFIHPRRMGRFAAVLDAASAAQ
jgi:FkbM family methyltransferase